MKKSSLSLPEPPLGNLTPPFSPASHGASLRKRFQLIFFFLTFPCLAFATTTADIQVDQVGYLSNETKLAMVTGSSARGPFAVCEVSGGATVLTGILGPTLADPNSGQDLRVADFSGLTATGNYTLNVAGLGQSYAFSIGPDVFSEVFSKVMEYYYGARCGTAVTLVSGPTTWSHEACHIAGARNSDEPAVFHPSSGRTGTLVTTKGWHDAGDYGKYMVSANISVGELLWAYEWYPAVLGKFNLHLPESGNGTPDILNECRWELDWMLTMQDGDGGVWAKVTSAGFPAGPSTSVMPDKDDAGPRYVIGTGKSPYQDAGATAGFAAVMAIAHRLYEPYDRVFAATCLASAKKAWAWALANPTSTMERNPLGVTTGCYGDGGKRTLSYLLWASAELYRTTGAADYRTYFESHYAAWNPLIAANEYPQDWANTKNLAYWAYYFTGKKRVRPVAASVMTSIYDATLSTANAVTARQSEDGYRVSLEAGDYIWGSNGGVGNYGILLLMANAMRPDANYTQDVLNDIHYLLGRNGNKISFVTDVGSVFPANPHHRPSWSDGVALPWPGMLAGGPNQRGGDKGATPVGRAPALCYIDDNRAYASNEVAVNWNAPLVFILASTLQAKVPTR